MRTLRLDGTQERSDHAGAADRRTVERGNFRADAPDMELNDLHHRWPIVCFAEMEAPRPQRNRIHLDVWVPHDHAEARVAAAAEAS